jgi:hypothetical protein
MSEAKTLTPWEQKMLNFITEHKDDPDLLKLPLPGHLLEMVGIKKDNKPINAMEATRKAFNATSLYSHQYVGTITTIDQTKMSDVKFPDIPSVNSKLPIAVMDVSGVEAKDTDCNGTP